MNPEALRAAASALHYWTVRQEVLANNLANTETAGFKGQRVFARLLDGTLAAEAATDATPGTLEPTGRPLDLAFEGDGFLVVDTPAGERWVRGGALSIDTGGRLVDAGGNPVLTESGPVRLPPGTVEIEPTGRILVDSVELGHLRIERSAAGFELQREGSGLWVPAGAVPVPAGERTLRQGYLERSNVDPITALVEMITIQRAHGAVERSMHVIDGVMSTVSNDLGRV